MIELNLEEMTVDEELSESLADIPQEGLLEELDEQEEVPAESPTENEEEESPSQEGEESEEEAVAETEEEETPVVNKEIPFHKNPRWQAMQEKNKALEARLEELSPLATQVEEMQKQVSGMKSAEVPAEFKEVFGENVDAFNNWQKLQGVQEQKIKREIIQEMKDAQTKEAQEQTAQQEAVQKNIEHIEDTYNVKLPEKSSDRNEFVKFMWSYRPTNDTGNLDFVKGWDLFEKTRESKVDSASIARKKVVKKTASDRKAEPVASDDFELSDFLPNQFKQH